MRHLLILILTLTALAGCEPLPPPPAPRPAEPVVLETPLEDLPEVAPVVAPVVTTPVQAEPVSPLLAQQRAACLREGGQMSPRGDGIYSCVLPTRDAGRSCTSAADCEGVCLARSGTCAPFQPLFGCQEVFTSPGRRETLCLE